MALSRPTKRVQQLDWKPIRVRRTFLDVLAAYDRHRKIANEVTWWGAWWDGVWSVAIPVLFVIVAVIAWVWINS